MHVCDKRDRAIACVFCCDSLYCLLVFYKKIWRAKFGKKFF